MSFVYQRNIKSILGKYSYYSAVSVYFFDYEGIIRGRRYFENIPSKHPLFNATQTRKNVQIKDINEIFPMLIRGHERTHHTQLLSSVYGLLLWRLYNQIFTNMGFIVRKLGESDLINSCSIPLIEWYFSNPSEEINNSIPQPDDIFLNNLNEQLGISFEEYQKEYSSRIKHVFLELLLFLKFFDTIQNNKKMSMRTFVEIANEVYRRLNILDDLKVQIEWRSYNLDSPSYLPPNPISATEMLEIDARMAQLILISCYKIEKDKFMYLLDHLFDANLSQKTNNLTNHLKNFLCVRFAIDVAINTPIDLSCSSTNPRILYVEDVLPVWRLHKIITAYENSEDLASLTLNLKENRGKIKDALWYDISTKSGIPSPKDALEGAFNNPIRGVNADADMKLYGIKPEEHPFSLIDQYLIREFKRGFQIRLEDSLAFTLPDKQQIEIFEPLIEFFNDKVILTRRTNEEYWLKMDILAFNKYIFENALYQIFLGEGDLSEIIHYYELFKEHEIIQRIGDGISNLDPKTLLISQIGIGICRKIRWN